MSLQAGSRLGPYEIVARVGSGGMGEVFRARDTRLDRTVALKTLHTGLTANAQLRLRLQHEAKAISALSHPNICALYDIGEHEGVDFLVMEFIEGESLADRLQRGPLPLRDAIRHGIEIAGALERAHREGLIHRDLKPGNVMLTRAGAKLLDFGLAKSVAAEPVSADAPTVAHTRPLTAEGTLIGTFQYMAPEQLEGLAVDARTDIFALGVVLYEMITGKRAFDGRTKTSIIASIVAGTPRPISELQPVTPPELEHLVARCLEKEPEARWQSAHDVRLELEWIAAHWTATNARPRRAAKPWLPWAVAALAALIAVAAGVLALRNTARPAAALPVYAHLLPPPGRQIVSTVETLSISPDGGLITFRLDGDDRLWLRPLGSNEARALDGTEHANLPFWSPDSHWIAFFADAKLKKVNVAGTPPMTVCDAPNGRSGAWNADDVILFSPSSLGPIHRVSANGGTSTAVTKLNPNETTHRWPVFLPDGRHFLYLAASHEETGASEGSVNLGSIDDPALRKTVLRGRSNAYYANGHVLHEKNGHLLAHPFDARRRELTGEPVRIASNVDSDPTYFRAAFAVASDGAVVFHRAAGVEDVVIMRQKPTGELVDVMQPGLDVIQIRVAPDRRHAAVAAAEPATGMNDLWLLDLEQKSKVRLTATPGESEWEPVWSPDGKRLVYTRSRAFQIGGPLVMKTIDGSARDQELLGDRVRGTFASDWSDDGKWIAYHVREPGHERWGDVYVLPLAAGAKPIPVAVGPAAECCSSLSPDSKWIVYRSDESGKTEVYARRFQDQGTAPIPLGTSREVRFGSAGELITLDDDGVKTVPLTAAGEMFSLGTPRLLFPRRPLFTRYEQTLDTDGKDLVLVTQRPNPYTQAITLLTKW